MSLLEGYVLIDGDCSDNEVNIYPNAPRLCDGLDNDCDVSIDETDTPIDELYALFFMQIQIKMGMVMLQTLFCLVKLQMDMFPMI